MKLLEQKIESLLFFKNEPLSYTWLSKVLETPKEVIKETISKMSSYYENRGISIVTTEDSAALMTSESAQELIASITHAKEERELSKQALETLSIIVYKGKATKPEVDYIRGVNSVFILRNLLMRGLITKKQNTLDKRSPYYVPTHDLLSFLGITNLDNLPGSEAIEEKIQELDQQFCDEQNRESNITINSQDDTSDEVIDND